MKLNKEILLYSLGTIFLSVIASFVYDFIKSEPILTSLYSVILFIVNGVLHFLSLQITVWWILVFLTVLFLASRIVDKLTTEVVPEPPEFTNYTEDRFHQWLWKWTWKWNSQSKKWFVDNLTPYCTDCNVRLVDRSNYLSSMAHCPNCNQRFESAHNNFEYREEIINLIHGKIENG